jgi:hypothetical protein
MCQIDSTWLVLFCGCLSVHRILYKSFPFDALLTKVPYTKRQPQGKGHNVLKFSKENSQNPDSLFMSFLDLLLEQAKKNAKFVFSPTIFLISCLCRRACMHLATCVRVPGRLWVQIIASLCVRNSVGRARTTQVAPYRTVSNMTNSETQEMGFSTGLFSNQS